MQYLKTGSDFYGFKIKMLTFLKAKSFPKISNESEC